LRLYDGSVWTTIESASTNANGIYAFPNVPALGYGQKYHVRYSNSTNPNYLSSFVTRDLNVYSACTNVEIFQFDIANIVLRAPGSDATVSLPSAFQWDRSNSTADSYEWNLFDINNPTLYAYTSPLVTSAL